MVKAGNKRRSARVRRSRSSPATSSSTRQTSFPGYPAEARWLVFVSSAFPKPRRPQIGNDRKAAAKAIESLDGFFCPWTWENNAYPGRFPPDELFLEEAERAHMLVLLIHDRLTPNTKKEYDASVKKGRSQIILFRDGFVLKKEAKQFRNQLKKATYFNYRNLSELKSLIIRGLQGNLLRYANIGLAASIGSNVDYGELGAA